MWVSRFRVEGWQRHVAELDLRPHVEKAVKQWVVRVDHRPGLVLRVYGLEFGVWRLGFRV